VLPFDVEVLRPSMSIRTGCPSTSTRT
jgi:hypothetical protein